MNNELREAFRRFNNGECDSVTHDGEVKVLPQNCVYHFEEGSYYNDGTNTYLVHTEFVIAIQEGIPYDIVGLPFNIERYGEKV